MAALRSMFSQMALQAAGAVLSFLLVVALAATLGADGYGVYAWVLSIGMIGALLLQAGLPTTILKRYAPLDLDADHQPLPVSDTFAVFTTLAVVAIAATSVATLAGMTRATAVWAVPVAAAIASLRIGTGILLSGRRPISAHMAEQVLRLIFVFALLLVGRVLGITDPAFYLFGYSVGALLAPVGYLRRLLLGALTGSPRMPQLLRPVGAHSQAILSQSVANHLPVFVSGFFLEPAQLAYLAVAIRLSGPVTFGRTVTRYYYGAIINRAVKASDLSAVRRLYGNSVMFSNATALPLSIALFFGMYFVMIFQPSGLADFEVTPELLTLFAGILVFRVAQTLTGPSQVVAILLGGEKFVRNVNILFLAGFAAGLIGAVQIAGTHGVVVVMIGYAFMLNGLVTLNLLKDSYKNA